MKKIACFTIFIMCLFTKCVATNFYISTSGNDVNEGTRPSSPWKTIARVNASFGIILPGDSILFKCGDIFYGSIIVSKSGLATHRIVFSSYGTGKKPIISGFTNLSNWESMGNGIYQCAVNAKNTVNMVCINGLPQAVGRYPNADAENGGYLTYTGFGTNKSFTCAILSKTNWTGAEVVSKKDGYVLERDIISGQSGPVITYRRIATINPRQTALPPEPLVPSNAGFGLFIQRSHKTLDEMGEWFFDTTNKKMQVYFGAALPKTFKTQVSTLDTLIDINNKNYITVANLAFEGANVAAIYFANAGNIIINNVTINNSGAKGIFGWNSPNIIVENSNITNSMCSAIDLTSRHANNVLVLNNTIKNTGVFPGMSSFFDGSDCSAISISVDSLAVIRKNRVDSTGYVGINFYGSGVVVDSNFVNYFDFVKDDGGGIYTFATFKTHRVVKNNIVLNGMGAPYGNRNPTHAEGIYMDGGARGVDIYGNTCAYMSNHGIYLNDPKDINVWNNTLYSTCGWGANKHNNDSIYNFTLKHNIFFNIEVSSELKYTYGNEALNSINRPVANNIQTAIQQLGDIDSNYYRPTPNNFTWNYTQVKGGPGTYFKEGVSLDSWRKFSGHDKNSIDLGQIPASKLLFDYNATSMPKVISLGEYKYKDAKSVEYTKNYTIPPFGSVILIKSN